MFRFLQRKKDVSARIYSLSARIGESLPAYPGDPKVMKVPIDGGEHCILYGLENAHEHMGTHYDAPCHVKGIRNQATLDSISPVRFFGIAQVIFVPDDIRVIDEPFLKTVKFDNDVTFIFFRTRNTSNSLMKKSEFDPNYVFLTECAAKYIAKIFSACETKPTVGIDYISIDAHDNPYLPVHKHLLDEGFLILEGLNLEQLERSVDAQHFEVTALPMPIEQATGAPAAVYAVRCGV